MEMIRNALRYIVGAVVGAAALAGGQFAVRHHAEVEVAPVSIAAGEVRPPPEEQLAQKLSDGYAFSEKMAQNAVSPGKDALVNVEYQGRSVWGCQVRVGSMGGSFAKASASAETPERACVQSILALNKDGSL